MERSLISWNIPNVITVALMAVLGWFVIVVVWQLARKGIAAGGDTSGSSTAGGY